jgi:hypothetical protein
MMKRLRSMIWPFRHMRAESAAKGSEQSQGDSAHIRGHLVDLVHESAF